MLATADTSTPSTKISLPAWVQAQLPPWSTETSTMTEPGFMDLTISSVMRTGATSPGHQRAEDDEVGVGDERLERLALLLQPLRRQRLGVAALAQRHVGGHLEAGDLGAEAVGLGARGLADVEGLDDAAQPLGGGDGLQTDDAGARSRGTVFGLVAPIAVPIIGMNSGRW